MDAQAQVSVRPISAALAAKRLAGCEHLDPRGSCSASDIDAMCSAGWCFELEGAARAVYVLNVRAGAVWIDAVKGEGEVDVTTVLTELVETQCAGASSIAFQTRRPGLVAKAERLGYRVTGWIVRKELQKETS